MSSMNILMLVDYRGQFYSAQRASTIGMDISAIRSQFEARDARLDVVPFRDVDVSLDYSSTFVLYQSSEDRDMHYKSYIADIILAIERAGGTLIPEYYLFVAHHNKAFLEMLRAQSPLPELSRIRSTVFGTLEDLLSYDTRQFSFPVVIKGAVGCKGQQVRLASNPKDLISIARKCSRSSNTCDRFRFLAKRFLRKGYIPESLHRRKFVVQTFLPGLTHDFKVLVYGKKYYVLKRDVRPNDFRASGSGRFSYPEVPPERVLDAAETIINYFCVPYISIDLAVTAIGCVAMEIQFLMFGTYTLEAAHWHFERVDGLWERVDGKSSLEEELADSLISYIRGLSFNENGCRCIKSKEWRRPHPSG